MDSLTQIVLGAAVGEAVLGKKIGNRAILWGGIIGTIPDLDVFLRSLAYDLVHAQELHRGFTHSIAFSIVMAPVFGWLLSKLYRKLDEVSWKHWSWFSFWCLFTHPVLDCFTNYGTQFFWPFQYRVSFQSIFVADPLYTVPFLIMVIVVLFNKRNKARRKKYNNLGLYMSTGYLLVALILKGFAHLRFANELERQGIEYVEMDTNPTPFNAVLWATMAETEEHYYIGLTSFFDSQDEIDFGVIEKNHELLGDFAKDDQVQRLIRLTRNWYAIEPADNGVYFYDLRFGLFDEKQSLRELPFGYRIYNENGKVIVTHKERVAFDMKGSLGKLFNRMWGN